MKKISYCILKMRKTVSCTGWKYVIDSLNPLYLDFSEIQEALILCIKLQRIASQKENIWLKNWLIAISAMHSSAVWYVDKNQSGNKLMNSESMEDGGSLDVDQ